MAVEDEASRAPGRTSSSEVARALAGALLLFAFLRAFVVQVYGIGSGSMQPTLQAGDYVLTSNAPFGAAIPFTSRTMPAFREPRAGDVVVYRPAGYDPPEDHIKRIVGVPEDTVWMVGGAVYRNGALLSEPHARAAEAPDVLLPRAGPYNYLWQMDFLPAGVDRSEYRPSRDNWGPLIVPLGHFLMLGDDRGGSIDSRHTGFVPSGEIRGRVLAIHWSREWSRIGDRP